MIFKLACSKADAHQLNGWINLHCEFSIQRFSVKSVKSITAYGHP